MNENILKTGVLYGVGVGPGDEELMTLKAIKTIQKCQVIVAPCAKIEGKSTALSIAKNFIGEDKKVIIKHFPMGGSNQEDKIHSAFLEIEKYLKIGEDVAFLTIGDPFIYSTYIYLLNYVKEKRYEAKTVPGITSFCAAASIAGETIVIGDERVVVTPASQINRIKDEKFAVIMKISHREKEVLDFLDKNDFRYVYVKRAYRDGQKIMRSREEILQNSDYMSLIIAHKK
ncbi:cobalt-factor II C(20)-methyltransferase [Clostridium sp. LBM24168]